MIIFLALVLWILPSAFCTYLMVTNCGWKGIRAKEMFIAYVPLLSMLVAVVAALGMNRAKLLMDTFNGGKP